MLGVLIHSQEYRYDINDVDGDVGDATSEELLDEKWECNEEVAVELGEYVSLLESEIMDLRIKNCMYSVFTTHVASSVDGFASYRAEYTFDNGEVYSAYVPVMNLGYDYDLLCEKLGDKIVNVSITLEPVDGEWEPHEFDKNVKRLGQNTFESNGDYLVAFINKFGVVIETLEMEKGVPCVTKFGAKNYSIVRR